MKKKERINWCIYTRGAVYFQRLALPLRAMHERAARLTLTPIHTCLFFTNEKKMWWALDLRELRRMGKAQCTTLLKPARRRRHFALFRRLFRKAVAAAEKIRALTLSGLSTHELVRLYEFLYRECRDAHGFMNADIDSFDVYPAERLSALLAQSFSAEPAETRASRILKTAAPAYRSYVASEELAVLKAALCLKKKKSDAQCARQIRAAAASFWWTAFGWESFELKTEADFEKAAADLSQKPGGVLRKRVRELMGTRARTLAERKRIFETHRIPSEAKKLITFFDAYARFHDMRKEMQMRTIYAVHLLMRETARRLGVPLNDVELCSPEEAFGFLAGEKIDRAELARRKKATAVFLSQSGMQIFSGSAAIRIKRAELDFSVGGRSEVRGVVASSGVARGIARICSGAREALAKIKHGDILVTGMTLPDYLPAMKRAAAIVTDEGGITCHAAIIAREMRKPCIIGTKIATKVLKDGMIVEVNANEGVVKIIKER